MAETNVIEVILRSVDEMSKDLARIQTEMGQFKNKADQVSVATTGMTRSAGEFRRIIGPARSAISQLTSAVALANPSMQILIRSVDDLTLSIAMAGLRAGSFAGALRFIFGPIGLLTALIIGVSAAIGGMVNSWASSKKATEEFTETMEKLKLELRKLGVVSKETIAQMDFEAELKRIERQLDRMQSKSWFGKGWENFVRNLGILRGLLADSPLGEIFGDKPEPFAKPGEKQASEAATIADAKRRLDLEKVRLETLKSTSAAEIDLVNAEADLLQLDGELTSDAGLIAEAFKLRERAINKAADAEIALHPIGIKTMAIDANKTVQVAKLREEYERLRVELIFQRTAATRKSHGEIEEGLEETDITKIRSAMQQAMLQAAEAMKAEAKQLGASTAMTFMDSFTNFMNDETATLGTVFRNIGLTLGKQLITAMLGELVLMPLILSKLGDLSADQKRIGSTYGAGGWIFNLLGLGGEGGGLGGLWPFAHGGMVIPHGAVRAFAGGGTVHGPTLGILGEEGSEIVARMKPARPGDGMGGKIQVIIQGDIVPRDPSMRPRDVVLVLADDMERGGRSAKAVEMVMRRGR